MRLYVKGVIVEKIQKLFPLHPVNIQQHALYLYDKLNHIGAGVRMGVAGESVNARLITGHGGRSLIV